MRSFFSKTNSPARFKTAPSCSKPFVYIVVREPRSSLTHLTNHLEFSQCPPTLAYVAQDLHTVSSALHEVN